MTLRISTRNNFLVRCISLALQFVAVHLCIESSPVLIDGGGQRGEGEQRRVEEIKGERTMQTSAVRGRGQQKPVPSPDHQSPSVVARLVQRLRHAQAVVEEATPMDLQRRTS